MKFLSAPGGTRCRAAFWKFLSAATIAHLFILCTADRKKDTALLGFVAAVLFIIAFLLNATSTTTSVVFSPTSLMLAGLACLALHLAGVGTNWSVPRGRTRR
jgi:hypothetical protein